MKTNEKGVLPMSEVFFHTESEFAKNALYYVIIAGDYFCKEDYGVERESFNSYLILLIHKGKMKIKYRNREFIATENTYVFLNCYYPHAYLAEEEVHFEYFHFDGSSSAKYFDFLFNKYGCVFPIENNIVLRKYMHQVVQMTKSDIKDEHFISMVIHKILYELTHITSTSEKMVDLQIRQVISFIENHFYEEITLEELAENMNLSVYYFARIFKRHTGTSPYQYILDYRIHHAKKLLQTTDDSIETIAFASGFNSLSHFVTAFKKRSNLTPKQFRKLVDLT
jgi:AraC-like DNA-binding protein